MKTNLFRKRKREDNKENPLWTVPPKNPPKTEIIFKRKRKYEHDRDNQGHGNSI